MDDIQLLNVNYLQWFGLGYTRLWDQCTCGAELHLGGKGSLVVEGNGGKLVQQVPSELSDYVQGSVGESP